MAKGHPPISRECKNCGKEFNLKYAWKDRVFCCSTSCSGELKKKPPIENCCPQCGKTFVAKKNHRHHQKFCSKNCQFESGLFVKVCDFCSKDFKIRKSHLTFNNGSHKRGKFCSNKCKIAGWKRDRLESQKASSYLRNGWHERERKCYQCGYNSHPEIIVIHHKDGNRSNGKIENLIPLCPTCHAEAHLKSGRHKLPSFRFRKILSG